MQQRQDDLETKLAHLELGLEELSQVVYAQSKQIERLQAHIEQFKTKLTDAMSEIQTPSHSVDDDRPPHY